MKEISVCKVKAPAYMIGSIVVHSLAIVMMATLLLLPKWVEMDSSLVKFTGNVHRIEDGIESGKSYDAVAEEWCEEKDKTDNLESYYYYNAGCEIFWNLSICSDVILGFQVVGILLSLLLILFFVVSIKRPTILYHIFFIALFSFLFQLIGLLIYLFLADITINGDCGVWYEHSEPGQLCGGFGVIFYISVVVFLGLFLVFQGYYNIRFYKEVKQLKEFKVGKIIPEKVNSIDSFPNMEEVRLTPYDYYRIGSPTNDLQVVSLDDKNDE